MLEGNPIVGIKNIAGSVYHIPLPEPYFDELKLSLCGHNIGPKVLAVHFHNIEDPNLCKHCAMQAIRRGA